jgi:Heavy-metal resistance protein CzcE
MENVMGPKFVVLTVVAMTLGFLNFSASAVTPGTGMGEVVPLSGAMRTIPINANTKYVNVTAHETVKFEVNGNAFAVNFNGSPATTFAFVPSAFDLNQVAPAGIVNHKVTVFIAPDPLYISG